MGKDPIFIDFSLLFTTELKTESIEFILKAGEKINAHFIPVIHLNDDDEIKNIVSTLLKETGKGICLRLICNDFSSIEELNNNLSNFLSKYKLAENLVDLLIDIKEVGNNKKEYDKYFSLGHDIANLKKWRTYTFASGSFLEDLSSCKIDDENLVPRLDWIQWQEKNSNDKLIRKPSFSDYTIQYPIYKDVTQFFPPTTSIKYTLKDEWLVMKGKKQRFELYLANAATLVDDDRFYGEKYSEGDKYVVEKAKHFPKYIEEKNRGNNIRGTGSTETWLKASINHHLTVAANQFSTLT